MFKKMTTLLVACSFFGQSLAFAAQPAQTPIAPSPEFTLVESLIVLQGQHLSQSAMEQQSSQVLSQYRQVAAHEGQNERFQQALVDLGVYTPKQAKDFMTDASSAAANLTTQGMDQESISTTVRTLSGLHPEGAQFSGCVAMIPVFLGGVVSGLCLLNVNETAADTLIIIGLAAGFMGYVFQETQGC